MHYIEELICPVNVGLGAGVHFLRSGHLAVTWPLSPMRRMWGLFLLQCWRFWHWPNAFPTEVGYQPWLGCMVLAAPPDAVISTCGDERHQLCWMEPLLCSPAWSTWITWSGGRGYLRGGLPLIFRSTLRSVCCIFEGKSKPRSLFGIWGIVAMYVVL